MRIVLCTSTAVGLLVASILSGCGSESQPVGNDGPGGASGGGSGGGVGCTEGTACECGDGREGVTQCSGSSPICSCDACPEFLPGVAVFQQCGGDPLGVWRTTSSDLAGFELDLYLTSSSGSSFAGTCAAQIESEGTPVDLRLQLDEGGDAALSMRGPSLKFTMLESCLRQAIGNGCDALEPVGDDAFWCYRGDCGICSCDYAKADAWLSGSWISSGSTLTLSSNYAPVTLPYCVQEGSMTILLPSNEVVTLRLSARVGAPTPCEQRSESECLASWDCHPGRCVGSSGCAIAATESDCTNRVGCSWDASQCGGTAPEHCSLGDYDIVPGCAFVDGKWGCAGTPPVCADLDVATCKTEWGCKAGPRCAGGALPCANFGCSSCPNCATIPGCTHTNTAPFCAGTTSCEAFDSQWECEWSSACSWILCEGTANSCEQYDAATCATVPGCSMQVVPM